jgi:hypothetical protein
MRPNGQHMLLNLRQVSRVYIDKTDIVFVTTESTDPHHFTSRNKTTAKKIYLNLSSVAEADAVFDRVEQCMSEMK